MNMILRCLEGKGTKLPITSIKVYVLHKICTEQNENRNSALTHESKENTTSHLHNTMKVAKRNFFKEMFNVGCIIIQLIKNSNLVIRKRTQLINTS